MNRVVEIKDRKLQDYVGDYNYYLEQNLEARRKELEREAELEAAAPKVKSQSKMTRVRTGQNFRLGSNKLGSVLTCLCCCRLYRALCKAASCMLTTQEIGQTANISYMVLIKVRTRWVSLCEGLRGSEGQAKRVPLVV